MMETIGYEHDHDGPITIDLHARVLDYERRDMSDLERLDEALAAHEDDYNLKMVPDHHLEVVDAARAYRDLLANGERVDRDVVDPFVAETLYEEHIAHNIDARGGMASESDWSSWDELPQAALDYWMGLAVAARLASRAALVGPTTEEEE